MRAFEDSAVFVRQPAEINFLSVGRGPRRRTAHFFGLLIFLASILLNSPLLEGYPIGAFPLQKVATVWTDVLLLSDDGYRLVRRRYYCRQAQQDNYAQIHPEQVRR